MLSVSIHGLTISGSTPKQFAFAMLQAAAVAALAKELGSSAPMAAKVNTAAPSNDYCAQWLGSALNVKGVSRFRMEKEEQAEFGEDRQAAARARLEKGGIVAGGTPADTGELLSDDEREAIAQGFAGFGSDDSDE